MKIGQTQGPPTVLTNEEEARLAKWAMEMAMIGYGRSKEQILLTVQKIVEMEKRPNPFKNGKPGKKWWQGFLRRHPDLSLRKPEQLESTRAASCTKQRLTQWFADFEKFLEIHEINDDPRYFWNADESGFALCPKSGKVLCQTNTKDLYTISGNCKDQITVLCGGSAAGEVIPPMHIYPGVRFGYNPLEGGVAGAYFGKSPNGWIDTELFYGWIANHFACQVKVRPVVLLVDGHRSHVNLQISTFCKENGIYLYCLLPHSSHITQPLDVGFFKPLKDAWRKACDVYKSDHPGSFVTKQIFARVFKEAWYHTIQPLKLMNAFRAAGIYPPNFESVRESRIAPSRVYDDLDHIGSADHTKSGYSAHTKDSYDAEEKDSTSAIRQLEAVLDQETLRLYNKRYEEEYDINDDQVYNVWCKLKASSESSISPIVHVQPGAQGLDDEHKSMCRTENKENEGNKDTSECPPSATSVTIEVTPVKEKHPILITVSSVLDDVLVYPKLPHKEKPRMKKSAVPDYRHLTGDQMIEYLETKEREKMAEAERKTRVQAEREDKRKARVLEAERKAKAKMEREVKRKVKEAEKKKNRKVSSKMMQLPANESDFEVSDDGTCELCGTDNPGKWISCDICELWYHMSCVGLLEYVDSEEWKCPTCNH